MNPPTLIGGSTPPLGSGPCAGFDAYCASVFSNPDALHDDLLCLLESAGFHVVPTDGPKVRFYARNRLLTDLKGHRLLSVKSGGANPHPWVECTGAASEAVGSYLRSQYDHRPTRIDHAKDLRASGLFEQMHDYAKSICKQHGLKLGYGGDWATPDAGRTIYIGSRHSQVCVRIYEKGLKYAHDLGLPVTAELREWVRFELEFKPQTKAAKSLAVSIDGLQLWGSTIWTNQLAQEVLSMATEPVSIRERRESNTDRALRFAASQYGRAFAELWKECGQDPAEFGRVWANRCGLLDDDAAEAA